MSLRIHHESLANMKSQCVCLEKGGGACAIGTFSVMLCWSRNINYLEVKNPINVLKLIYMYHFTLELEGP